MMKYYFKSYTNSIKKMLIECFALIGGFYTAFEILTLLFPNQIDVFQKLFMCSIAFSFLFTILHNIPKRRFTYQINNKDIKITVVIGDLYKERGAKVIPTNTTFDTKMEGEFISPKSIQGQYQDMYYKNNIDMLDTLIFTELEGKEYINLDRKRSKVKQYPIGTVIKLNNNGRCYLLATADVNTDGKPTSNFENIQISLESLWNYILDKGHMEPIIIPIIGTGRTGLTVKRQKIVKEIIFSFIAHTNEKKITDELIICIHPDDVINIDLNELKEYLDSVYTKDVV